MNSSSHILDMARRTVTLIAALAALMLVVAEPGVAQEPGLSGTIIVTNKSTASASIIDVATNRVLATVPTGAGPHEIALSSDGATAVVTDYGGPGGGQTLTVIDVAGMRVARTIDLGQYRRPHGIVFLPGDSLVAVTSEASGNVLIVAVAAGAVRRAIPTNHQGSHMVGVIANATRAYTGDIGSNTVSELNLSTGEYVRSWDVPAEPEAINVTPDGTQVWVGSNATGRVSVVDPSTGSVTTAAEGLQWPYRILFTPDGSSVLLPDLSGEELRIIDRMGFTELARIDFSGAAPQGITITPDGRYVFQSLSSQGRVAIVDMRTRQVADHLAAGESPDGVVYTTRVLTAGR